jgi:hypothetical protein
MSDENNCRTTVVGCRLGPSDMFDLNSLLFLSRNAHYCLTITILCDIRRGAGGMFDTRDPEAYEDEDPRKSISEAPSFEEYLKKRQAEGN